MSEQHKAEFPYKSLGVHLRRMRQNVQESIAEVSGAVEIDVELLSSIERGTMRPSEDILLLLISHFGAKEDEAMKLWELAQFDTKQLPAQSMINDDSGVAHPTVLIMPQDSRIVYTDVVNVVVNNYGVVINFLQSTGSANSQPMVVARVGMSKEHAESVIKVLQQTFLKSTQAALPAPQQKNKKP